VLANPRGRRFCFEVAAVLDEDVRAALWTASSGPDDEDALASLTAALRASDAASVGALSEQVVTECLADAVCEARYWQEPDPEDVVLARQDVASALAPLA